MLDPRLRRFGWTNGARTASLASVDDDASSRRGAADGHRALRLAAGRLWLRWTRASGCEGSRQRIAAPACPGRNGWSEPDVRRRPAGSSRRSMLRSRRDKPVYLVYDEDAFLATPNGGLSVAPEAGSPGIGRPYARRRSWKGGLVLAVAAATAAQLIASRVNDDQGRWSWPTDHHPQAATNRHPDSEGPRWWSPRRTARDLGRPRCSSSAIVHARSDTAMRGAPVRPPGPDTADHCPDQAGRSPAAAGPFSPAPGPQPASIGPGSPITGAAHEFGFEG